jgi:hypothetical protein
MSTIMQAPPFLEAASVEVGSLEISTIRSDRAMGRPRPLVSSHTVGQGPNLMGPLPPPVTEYVASGRHREWLW